MSDETHLEIPYMLYYEMTRRARKDDDFRRLLFDDAEAALTAYFSRPIRFMELSPDQRSRLETEVRMARARYSNK